MPTYFAHSIIKIFLLVSTISLIVPISGCARLNNQDLGTITGAAIGGLAGSSFGQGGGKTASTIGGAVAGGYIGSQLGKNMDR